MKRGSCHICSRLAEPVEIRNDPFFEDGKAERFPDEFDELVRANARIQDRVREKLLVCPRCRCYYHYRTWSPGGSEDALKTWIFESVRPMSLLEANIYMLETLEGEQQALEADEKDYPYDWP